jgi:hypothetical protein
MLRSAGRRVALHHCSSLPPPSTSAAAGRPLGVGRGELVSIERRRTSAKHSRSGMGLQAGPPRRLRGHRRPPAPRRATVSARGPMGVGWDALGGDRRSPGTASRRPSRHGLRSRPRSFGPHRISAGGDLGVGQDALVSPRIQAAAGISASRGLGSRREQVVVWTADSTASGSGILAWDGKSWMESESRP